MLCTRCIKLVTLKIRNSHIIINVNYLNFQVREFITQGKDCIHCNLKPCNLSWTSSTNGLLHHFSANKESPVWDVVKKESLQQLSCDTDQLWEQHGCGTAQLWRDLGTRWSWGEAPVRLDVSVLFCSACFALFSSSLVWRDIVGF